MTVLGEGRDKPYVGQMYVGEPERRQGNVTRMIENAGDHYGSQGKRLQSGQLTNDGAVAVWDKLVRDGKAEALGDNRFQYGAAGAGGAVDNDDTMCTLTFASSVSVYTA